MSSNFGIHRFKLKHSVSQTCQYSPTDSDVWNVDSIWCIWIFNRTTRGEDIPIAEHLLLSCEIVWNICRNFYSLLNLQLISTPCGSSANLSSTCPIFLFINNLNTIYYFQRHVQKILRCKLGKNPSTVGTLTNLDLRQWRKTVRSKWKKKETTIYFHHFSIRYMMNRSGVRGR